MVNVNQWAGELKIASFPAAFIRYQHPNREIHLKLRAASSLLWLGRLYVNWTTCPEPRVFCRNTTSSAASPGKPAKSRSFALGSALRRAVMSTRSVWSRTYTTSVHTFVRSFGWSSDAAGTSGPHSRSRSSRTSLTHPPGLLGQPTAAVHVLRPVHILGGVLRRERGVPGLAFRLLVKEPFVVILPISPRSKPLVRGILCPELSAFFCNESSSQGRCSDCRSGPRLQEVEPVSHPEALAFEIGRVGR
jgi:hypothetical protein